MKKSPISVRIIYFLSVIAFWLLIFVATLSFIANLLIETKFIGSDFQLRISLPVNFDVSETGTAYLYGVPNDIRIEEATGKMHIVDTPIQFSKIVLRVLFVVSALGLFMTWKFKLFIGNIKVGRIFEADNINNLKHIAYGLLILWLITKVYMTLLYRTMVKYVEFDSIHFRNEVTDASGLILAALLLWILAHVFMKGVEMKEEQELTI